MSLPIARIKKDCRSERCGSLAYIKIIRTSQ